jgi:hypothetical protein
MEDVGVIAMVASALVVMLIATAALLHGWRGWLELKRAELDRSGGGSVPSPSPQARIELADLKERVRRLEAIANGVEG